MSGRSVGQYLGSDEFGQSRAQGAIGAGACCGKAPAAAKAPSAPSRIKSVVIIFADDQGAHLGALGTPDTLVSETDLMPTILDFIGLPIPSTVQGKSLRPLLTGATKSLPDRKYVFTEHNSHGPAEAEIYPSRAVFDGRYYYIKNLIPGKDYTLPADLEKSGPPWFNGSYDAAIAAKDQFPTQYLKLQELLHGRPPEELYDMQFDAGQLYNLAGDTANRAKLLELRDVMAKWRKDTGDYRTHPREIVRRESPEAKF